MFDWNRRSDSIEYPDLQNIRDGLGEIKIAFHAALPGGEARRRLIFENHHENAIAVYLVNCLVPEDPDIHLLAQSRNEQQSFYQLDYFQQRYGSAGTRDPEPQARFREWQQTISNTFAGFGRMFTLGMHHIAEGTDHLLFLLALLLPAPLLPKRSRWSRVGDVRHCLLQILRVVTAFTLGHSLTLMLSAMGIVRLPSRPVEVLIAFSILVSAAHAIRPLFPGREPLIAGSFGLIHGLAFAATLSELGVTLWQRLAGIAAFNLGIEAMQLLVVSAAALPSLLLFSRTRVYPLVRLTGGTFAAVAALGWIAERLWNLPNAMAAVVTVAAHHAVWIAATASFLSVVCRRFEDSRPAGHWRDGL